MFDQMADAFDHGFTPVGSETSRSISPLKRRKSLKSRITFWLVNLLLVAPAIIVVYLTVVADGLRASIDVFATRLNKLPVPGAGMLAQFDGFDRIDIASVTALILCVTVSYLWYRIFIELSGHGRFNNPDQRQMILMWFFGVMAIVIIVGDALIFLAGMTGQASGWGGSSQPMCIGATVVYAFGLALLGGYHADYHTSGEL
ncbi:MAG: hypothetical protein AAFX06_21295 [Planctomycetota bacterium]